MADIVNLRRYRKQADRKLEGEQAAVKRAEYGRSKQAKAHDHAQSNLSKRVLDQHRIIDTGDER